MSPKLRFAHAKTAVRNSESISKRPYGPFPKDERPPPV